MKWKGGEERQDNKLPLSDSFQFSNCKSASYDVKHDKDPRLSRSDICKADIL